jgi:hypothetical protein
MLVKHPFANKLIQNANSRGKEGLKRYFPTPKRKAFTHLKTMFFHELPVPRVQALLGAKRLLL